jgi:hypothetical protein
MKKFYTFILVFILVSCEGSDVYQGKWKAMNSEGKKFEIIFAPNNFIIKNKGEKLKSYKYTQNSIEYKNSVKIYGITLQDGRLFQIIFPTPDLSKGFLINENGVEMFTISKNNYIKMDDLRNIN